MWALRSHRIGVAPGPTITGYALRPSMPASSSEDRVTAPPHGAIVRIRWAEVCEALTMPTFLPLHWLMSVLFWQTPSS